MLMLNLVLAGSRSEAGYFINTNLVEQLGPHFVYTRVEKVADLFRVTENNVLLHVVGTARHRKDYDDILELAVNKGIRIINHVHPRYVICMPSMEIAHDFADRLGISPEWRYRSPQSDSA